MMEICSDSDELELFHSDAMQNFVKYKWETYGRQHHKFGLMMHIFYVISLILYVHQVYMLESEYTLVFNCLLFIGILYPAYYDICQLLMVGIYEYVCDPSNLKDVIYIYGSITNVFL
jgi:uncharacterized membrane protein YesL